MTVKRTRLADEDLIEIWLYIAGGNLKAADAVLDRIESIFHFLDDNPKIGRERNDIKKGLRYFPVDNYLVLYRIIKAGIEIVRVIHGARKIDDLF